LIKEKQWEDALVYLKKTQVIDPDYQKGKVHECIADVFFNFRNQQWETVQELYNKSISKYTEELNDALDSNNDDVIPSLKFSISNVYIKKGK
jgi:hypothetical protein